MERVQHPGLYRQYMVRRDQMEHKSSSNEKLLFHGTAGASLPTVSKHGFKRNYCDKNVASRVSGRVHTINGTKVEVSLYPFSRDYQSQNVLANQARVVAIRGLSQSTTVPTVLHYFEDPEQSGGGAIEEANIHGNSVLVKFKSSEVAHRVVKQHSHFLDGATLDVNFELLDTEASGKIIEITGLSTNSSEDSVWNYFENKRNGGGEVETVDFRPARGVAFVTFKDAHVARSVLQHSKHTLDGATLDVKAPTTETFLPNLAIPQEQRVIEVTGLALTTTKDAICNFFENRKRSGGGDVESVNHIQDQGFAVVTFATADIAKSVLEHGALLLDGTILNVKARSAATDVPGGGEIQELRTIEVTGLAPTTTKDSIVNFFENRKRSGGGDIETIDHTPEGGIAFITFETADSADGVLRHGKHTLDGAILNVKIITIKHDLSDTETDEPRTIEVTGLAVTTTEDAIINFFENNKRSGGGDVESVHLTPNQGIAVVTFTMAKTAKCVLERDNLTLDGATLSVSVHNTKIEPQDVEVTQQPRTIEVTGLAPTTTEDAIVNFFENKKRTGGGDVESVDYNPDRGTAVVTFTTADSVGGVLRHGEHSLDGAILNVKAIKMGTATLKAEADEFRTIQVTGLSGTTSKDAIVNFFENKKRSGGGEVESISHTPDQGVAVITFTTTESMDGVLRHREHTLDGAILKVKAIEIGSNLPAAETDKSRTIEVTGLATATTKDAIINFFENNKRSGGGDVESINHTPDQGTAVITFTTAESADGVLRHGEHTLDGAILKVKGIKIGSNLSIAETDKSRTIEVTGLATATTKDAIINFFENNKRSGGGDVESINHTPDQGTAVITFTTAESADGVLRSGEHTLDGAILKVKAIKIGSNSCAAETDESRTIEVTGLATATTKDAIINFFENNKRSGGGDIESINHTPDRGTAVITFTTVESTDGVLGRGEHTLDGAILKVKAIKIRSYLPAAETYESRTIEVTGLAATTTKDAIVNFFENNKRSGGGDVQSIDHTPDQGTAVITFTIADSALEVVNKGNLTLDEAQLKVTLKQSRCKVHVDTRKLIVRGLDKKTTKTTLGCYMEKEGGAEVLSVDLGNEGCALVSFREAYDYQFLTKKISEKPLDGKTLSVEQVPVCHCVQVTGLSKEKTTEDGIRYYFASAKNNGGDVSHIDLNIKEGWALVYFEDPEVVFNVVRKSHVLDQAELDVRAYYPFLGKPQTDEPEVELLRNIDVDAQKVRFILENCKPDVIQIEDEHGVTIAWKEDLSSVAITPSNRTSGNKNSFDKACEAFTTYLNEFSRSTLCVHPEAWNAVQEKFRKNGSHAKEKVKATFNSDKHEIVLMGKKQEVEAVAEDLESLSCAIEKKMKIEASKTTKEIDKVPVLKLQLLRHLDFEKELEAEIEETEVKIIPEEERVRVRGPPDSHVKVSEAIWKAVANVKELKLDMTQNALTVLKSTATQKFIKDHFTANNLQAFLIFDSESERNLVIMGMKTDVVDKARDLVKELIVEDTLNLDEDHIQFKKSKKWSQLMDGLTTKRRVLSLSFDTGNKRVCLAGSKEDVLFASEAVKRFLEENTIVNSDVRLSAGCRRFLVRYQEQELRRIEDELVEYSIKIRVLADKDDGHVVVSGTMDGVNQATKLIRDLASKVENRKVFFDKPGMRKLLDGNKGKKILTLLENEHKCVIEHVATQNDRSKGLTEEEKEASRKKRESLRSFRTSEGKKIMVFKDSICDRAVDVIVNAANSKLKHKDGVSKAIAQAAGKAMQDECDRIIINRGEILEGQVVETTAGKLPFKKVIHAVGPRWRKEAARQKSFGKIPQEEKFLRFAVTNALDTASRYNSVAIPAIGTGAFEFPQDLCARIMVESALEFYKENPSCCLSEIHFSCPEDEVAKAFVDVMDSRFLQDPNYETASSPKKRSQFKKPKFTRKPKTTPSSETISLEIPNGVKTPEGLKVVLVTGDMRKEKVDVIVNSTSPELDLSKNASAKALSSAAGPKLQEECNMIGKVGNGEVVVTSGANLTCKHVFHTTCIGWQDGKGEKVLRDIIKKCLDEAQKRGVSSIAIPAIGTGNLKFPHDRVATASFDEVFSFSKNNPKSTLKEVHLVVYDKDLASVQAFQTELQNQKRGQPESTPPPLPKTESRQRRRHGLRGMGTKTLNPDTSTIKHDAGESMSDILDPIKPEIIMGNVFVQAEIGDITKEETDAIATLSNEELDVAYGGGVGKAILDAGGQIIQAECSSLGPVTPGSISVTGAGKLQVRYIYHMVRERNSNSSMKECIFNCLQKVDSDGLTSVSFPAVGTGIIKSGAKEAAEILLSAISKFAQEHPTSLAIIRIVIFQPHMLQAYRNAMEKFISSSEGESGLLSKIVGWLGFGKSGSAISNPTEARKMLRKRGISFLDIFAASKEDIDKIVEEIERDVADNCKIKTILNDAISKLSTQQTRKIVELQLNHDAVVTIEEAVGRISIRGDADDVLDIATEIHEILSQQIEEEHVRGVGELLCRNIQWYSYYPDDHENLDPYDARDNLRIEEAFNDGKESVIVVIDENRYEIVFKDMIERCVEDGEESIVVRKVIGKGVPIQWEKQPTDDSGKEKEFHLVSLDPVTHSKEYRKVAGELGKTSAVTIIKIERVQNPTLYRAYMVKKEQMDRKNGSNEKALFHGTAGASCSSINHHGFNRSYCGKNATVYGNGVYFARDASYSTQNKYSPPDGAGNRYMYLARVLVGEYTTGRQGMITPPPKGADATDAYDTVVDKPTDPTIFVVFYDNQCYPDYLITFK
ncbi:poly [ADP-ribose] polymerase 14-like isoform X2 [Stylophora pistillata]|uniref:poly [ADP-ribose] polymerase 14-like isoform X2 n=1 Tax=Stylophora pistillata TaxID=50429 RepID=UPI000C03E8FC|nr:poly [ADP-ribose] polymerase 14-like isoform X2 [Stylophora pistillata]XP_022795890.1 poly [ADP-ribose] polymerase 14-like isoform X2 [Stylophora pistillata]XP_022795891.1 poly [ADP-ribose] polymerase 14-like isoform X2 [Stylophora pistillata]